MDIESLRSFLAVVRTGSFTKAAQELYVTQPTLSRRVRDLETELDTRLLIREARSVKLTPEGVALKQAVVGILHDFDELPQVVRKVSIAGNCPYQLTGTITFGRQVNVNQFVVAHYLKYFQRLYPKIDVYVRSENTQTLSKLVSSGVVDVSFTLRPDIKATQSNSDILLGKTKLCLLVPIAHPFAGRTSVDISELKDQEFIMCERRLIPEVSDFIVSSCISNGFSIKTSRYVSAIQDQAALVSVGKGIAFSSDVINYGDPLTTLDICRIGITGADLTLNYVARVRKDMPDQMREAVVDSFCSFKKL